MILVEYIESEKYGKIAHFINEENIDVYSKVIVDEDITIYEELSETIQQEFRTKDDLDEY